MTPTLPTLSLSHLLLAFLPSVLVLGVLHRWSLGVASALWANVRMAVQLLAVGFVLTSVFRTERPVVVAVVVLVMVGASAWISIRPLRRRSAAVAGRALVSIGLGGMAVLAVVTQLVLELPRWFEPSFVVPLAGMIFANAMNTVSLAAERFESERGRGAQPVEARNAAFDASLIPQINGLLAVGLVSLPGMMTGQILSGVEPLVAVRYQIVVMCMVFAAGGSSAACYLALASRRAS